MEQEFSYINSDFDYSTFDIEALRKMLKHNVGEDYQTKKSALQQLSMLLFDRIGKKGSGLF